MVVTGTKTTLKIGSLLFLMIFYKYRFVSRSRCRFLKHEKLGGNSEGKESRGLKFRLKYQKVRD